MTKPEITPKCPCGGEGIIEESLPPEFKKKKRCAKCGKPVS